MTVSASMMEAERLRDLASPAALRCLIDSGKFTGSGRLRGAFPLLAIGRDAIDVAGNAWPASADGPLQPRGRAPHSAHGSAPAVALEARQHVDLRDAEGPPKGDPANRQNSRSSLALAPARFPARRALRMLSKALVPSGDQQQLPPSLRRDHIPCLRACFLGAVEPVFWLVRGGRHKCPPSSHPGSQRARRAFCSERDPQSGGDFPDFGEALLHQRRTRRPSENGPQWDRRIRSQDGRVGLHLSNRRAEHPAGSGLVSVLIGMAPPCCCVSANTPAPWPPCARGLRPPRPPWDHGVHSQIDEAEFARGVGRVAAHVIEQQVVRQPLPMHKLVSDTSSADGSRQFRVPRPELTA
jgi:hypothetical protein